MPSPSPSAWRCGWSRAERRHWVETWRIERGGARALCAAVARAARPVPRLPPPQPCRQRRNADVLPVKPRSGYLWRHPARWIALGFGSGLSPWAPGTVGTLWAWVAWLVLSPWLGPREQGLFILAAGLVGWWACTRTARELGSVDPSVIVWDEVVAFWLVLWLLLPAALWQQALAFVLFRFFDALKPGPVGWADRALKGRPGALAGPRQGLGILLDDVVAAGCTLLLLALLRLFLPGVQGP